MILFPPKVHIIEETHQYFNDEGEEYASLSRVLNTVKTPFDKEGRSVASANKEGVSQEEILKRWSDKAKDSTDHGTRIHKALEVFKQIGKVPDEFKDLKTVVQAVMREYGEYYRLFSEVIVHNDEFKIAGTIDRPMLVSQHKNSALDIDDFKTNKFKGIEYFSKYGNYMREPFGYLTDCNFTHYTLQLSCYAYMLQELTGRKIRRLNILYIPFDDPLAFRRIPVMYMKNEAKTLFEHYRALNPVGVKKEVQKEGALVLEPNSEPTFE